MTDLISREAAIEAVRAESVPGGTRGSDALPYNAAIVQCIEALSSLPSVDEREEM